DPGAVDDQVEMIETGVGQARSPRPVEDLPARQGVERRPSVVPLTTVVARRPVITLPLGLRSPINPAIGRLPGRRRCPPLSLLPLHQLCCAVVFPRLARRPHHPPTRLADRRPVDQRARFLRLRLAPAPRHPSALVTLPL